MYNPECPKNEAAEQHGKILKSIKIKEKQASDAKSKGMHASFGILMEEITELRRKLRKQQTGGR